MPKLLQDNGNIKSVLLKELNVEIICGMLDGIYPMETKATVPVCISLDLD